MTFKIVELSFISNFETEDGPRRCMYVCIFYFSDSRSEHSPCCVQIDCEIDHVLCSDQPRVVLRSTTCYVQIDHVLCSDRPRLKAKLQVPDGVLLVPLRVCEDGRQRVSVPAADGRHLHHGRLLHGPQAARKLRTSCARSPPLVLSVVLCLLRTVCNQFGSIVF